MSDSVANTVAGILIVILTLIAVYYSGVFSGLEFSQSQGTVSEEDALQIAEAYLNKDTVQYDSLLKKDSIKEYNFGWAVQYTTPEHMKELQPSYGIPGSGVIIINRNGELTDTGPQKNVMPIIKRLEEDWKQ